MRAVALSAETMRADPPADSSREQARLVPLPAAIPSSDETPDRGPVRRAGGHSLDLAKVPACWLVPRLPLVAHRALLDYGIPPNPR